MCAEQCAASQILLCIVNACEGVHHHSLLGKGRTGISPYLYRVLGGPQMWSGHSGEEKTVWPWQELNRVSHSSSL